MKKLLCVMLMSFSTVALAAPMKDFSMSTEESLRDAAQSKSATQKGWNNNYVPSRESREDSSLTFEDGQKEHSNFMSYYCDARTQLGILKNRISECVSEKRRTACEEYAAIPADARKALNLTVDCAYAQSPDNQISDEENELGLPKMQTPKGCDDEAEARIALLRKYHNDAYTTHALLFLPDMVLKAGNDCVAGR